MAESTSSFRGPWFLRLINVADELILSIPDDVACKLWGVDKGPTNVMIHTVDGRLFNVSLSADNKMFKVAIETSDGKVGFTVGIDMIVSLLQLKAGCILLFTKGFGNFFHLKIFGKNGVEMNFPDVDVDEAEVAPIDAENEVDEQIHGCVRHFTRMAGERYFRSPDPVSRMARLDEGLKDITVRLMHLDPPKQFTNGTRREKKRDGGWRYALTSWKKFMKAARIKSIHLFDFFLAIMKNEGQITLLNDIDALSTNYTIKVKIVSLWRKKMRDNERETYRIDMILMDEKGTKIQASCLHKLFSKFERHLNVDECLIIKRSSLAANTASFKIVPNNQKLSFYYHTFVEKCNIWEDFIGYVGVCYNIEETNKKDGSKGKRLNLKLQDLEDVQIDLTLWDDYAKDMYSYMVSENREAHVVVVVHFGAVKTYKGKWGFSNNFDGSRLFINDNFDDMLSFKQKFLAKLAASTESSSHAGSYMMCSPKKVVVVGTIVAIVSDKMWYYDGCNYCKSKVEQKFETYDKDDGTSDVRDEKLYQCSNKDCNGKEVFPLSRFKIPVRVQDSTGTVTLTLFDHEALKFVGKTAKELIQIQDELLKTNDFPREYLVEFESLVNLKCAFVIKVIDFNIVNAVENYGISVVTTDDDILDKLNKKFKIDQLDVSDSFGMSQSEFQTSGGECLKDADSYTEDNTTPVSKDYVGDLKQSSSDLKHNLDDVYLNEVGLASSANTSQTFETSSWLSEFAFLASFYGGISFFHHSLHFQFEQLTSYSSERPHIGLDNKSEQAKCTRSLRKLYLDNKKSSADAFPDYFVRVVEAKHRRKLRKLYLDSKRSKITKKFISRGGASTSSSSTRILLNNKENLTLNFSNTTFPTESSTVIRTIDNIASSSTLPLNDCYSLNPRITNKCNTTSLTSEFSSIKKMSSGKRRLIHKPIEIEPIPMAVLDSDDENHVHEVVLDATKGVSKDYVDHGDQSLTCGLCFAKLWPTEGGKGRITLQKQTYSLCYGYGKVNLPEYKDSDPSYQMLFRCLDQESKFFLKNKRRYNSMFSFTSMGGKVDTKINKGNAPFVYRISGQNAHCMGSLLPKHGDQPKFSQLYIYDTENELANRELLFGESSSKASLRAKELDVKFIKFLTNMLDSTNMLVKTYRMRDRDSRTYNLPTCSEVVALIVDEPDLKIESRDIIVEKRLGVLKSISELHPLSYSTISNSFSVWRRLL
ncbi:uncharacterized protein LOC110932414 [Helianthus annuus]|uniref:uncharacterized protein LOC110932414 n=1 Tax=Helianthus annuus TaxID=4232 RepID=UPI0016532E90|nr:uncharacterized protein LOC110932414 [Helianthus annuus]